MMMAKMKYSEIPRDLSSDSVAAFRLAQVSDCRLPISRLINSKLSGMNADEKFISAAVSAASNEGFITRSTASSSRITLK